MIWKMTLLQRLERINQMNYDKSTLSKVAKKTDIGNLKQHYDSLFDDEKAIRVIVFSHILKSPE